MDLSAEISYDLGMARKRTDPSTAFAQRYAVDPISGCWNWTGDRTSKGYGQWVLRKILLDNGRYRKERIYAHRLSWKLNRGPIPEGLRVLHDCDNPSCVNPEHLFLGTMADNTQDMISKGRESRGEDRPGAKLTEKNVAAIRLSTETCEALAISYGVAFQTINDIRRRKTWTHVSGERADDPKRNQGRPGSQHAGAVLHENDIPLIRARLANGEGCTSIGRAFSVSDAVIRQIKNGKTWKHVA